MFEPNMDEYLDEEVEALKVTFGKICKEWEKQVISGCNSAPYVTLIWITRLRTRCRL